MKINNNNLNVGQSSQSLVIMGIISLVLFGGIAMRLAYLQIAQGDRYKQLTRNNRIRTIYTQPVRGNIFDRNGKILATSKLTHSVFILPAGIKKDQWNDTLKRLTKILNIPPEEIEENLKDAEQNPITPVKIAKDITPEQIIALQEYNQELPGVQVEIEPVRVYPYGEVGSHIVGYTREVTADIMKKRKNEGYKLGDNIGLLGLEAGLERRLGGQRGKQEIEVDRRGKAVKMLEAVEAKPGEDIHLTIDIDLQKICENILGGRSGAIVVLNPNDGSVYAMASNPNFDPNIFSKRISPEVWKKIQEKDDPFVNRALRGFPPASTFKIVTTTAALESGKYSANTYLPTYPYLKVGGTKFGEWNKAGFGTLGFVGGLRWSSDTFFYQIGMGVGGEKLINWTRKYGFGRKTGIELSPEESPGLVADEVWKRKNLRQLWTIGDTINMSIGQGFLVATPMQVAVMFSVPANGGYLIKPHLLKDDQDSKKWRESLNIKPSTLAVVQDGLKAVVNGGTGSKAAFEIPSAGKTGTAEAPPRLSHAWYGGYAPINKSEIVVVAFLEHSGGGGGKMAAPIVKGVMQSYFALKKQNNQIKKK